VGRLHAYAEEMRDAMLTSPPPFLLFSSLEHSANHNLRASTTPCMSYHNNGSTSNRLAFVNHFRNYKSLDLFPVLQKNWIDMYYLIFKRHLTRVCLILKTYK
jgi:hypothetical protein